MYKEKRTGRDPLSANIEEELSHPQLLSLRQIERFGWYLKFIRKPLFMDRLVVVYNAEDNKLCLLESDGKMNMHADVDVRELSMKNRTQL